MLTKQEKIYAVHILPYNIQEHLFTELLAMLCIHAPHLPFNSNQTPDVASHDL